MGKLNNLQRYEMLIANHTEPSAPAVSASTHINLSRHFGNKAPAPTLFQGLFAQSGAPSNER